MMRFFHPEKFKRQDYVEMMGGFACLATMKTRLNMDRIYGNYKGDLTLDRLCPYCREVDDTTEHMIECPALGETKLCAEDLKNDSNKETWKQLNEKIKFNLEHRSQ